MAAPPLNIKYWASLFPVYTEYAEQYDAAFAHDSLRQRAEELWEWKGLNRSIPFEQIETVLDDIDPDEYTDQGHEAAITGLSDELIDAGVVETPSLVTAAFLLHLMASGPERYSAKFPIYDRRVWNAYVYLWRVRDEGEHLYRQASQSVSAYGDFCRTFGETCVEGQARAYERALFMFGGFIMDLPSEDSRTPITTIDETLAAQETALTEMHDRSGFALLDLDAIRGV